MLWEKLVLQQLLHITASAATMTKPNSSSTGWWLSMPTSENQVWAQSWTGQISLPYFAFMSHLQSEVDNSTHLRVAASEFSELVAAKDLT